jgi:hypothetical protein
MTIVYVFGGITAVFLAISVLVWASGKAVPSRSVVMSRGIGGTSYTATGYSAKEATTAIAFLREQEKRLKASMEGFTPPGTSINRATPPLRSVDNARVPKKAPAERKPDGQ